MDTSGAGPLAFEFTEPMKKVGRERDGRVCVCGHGAKSHGANESKYMDLPLTEVPAGKVSCVAGRHQCACVLFYPILETDDVRRFMSRTVGPDMDHALARGVNSAMSAGVRVQWRDDLACGKCGTTEEKLTPVGVKVRGDGSAVFARSTAEYNYMLCPTCRQALPVEADLKSLAVVSKPDSAG